MPKTKKKSRSRTVKSVPVAELIGVADDYLTVACLATVYAKDATSKRSLDRIGNALYFASKIVTLSGGVE